MKIVKLARGSCVTDAEMLEEYVASNDGTFQNAIMDRLLELSDAGESIPQGYEDKKKEVELTLEGIDFGSGPEAEAPPLTLPDIHEDVINALRAGGFDTVEKILAADSERLLALPGFDQDTLDAVLVAARAEQAAATAAQPVEPVEPVEPAEPAEPVEPVEPEN